jgi:CRP-like cAMP-binding protein
MVNAFIRKLQGYATVDAADIALLEAACATPRTVPPHADLIRDGDKPTCVFIMLEGWAHRYKLLPDGSRQITAFLLPGDFCDMHIAILDEMDHSIGTLTRCSIATVPRPAMERLTEKRSGITRAFWWTQLVDEATLRAWIVNLGRHDATQRVAHLLSELWQRAIGVDLVVDNLLRLPLTQTDIGDALGLTNIHVNRVLQDLRNERLIWLGPGRSFAVLDVEGLADKGGFQPRYLHRKRAAPLPGRRTGSSR